MKNLIIVESPAKAKKIKTFFKDDTIVLSSYGHIVDLPKERISIDIDNNFKPDYHRLKDKQKIINDLCKYSKNSNVLLAADDDREGDAIAWHCGNIMKVNFNEKNRIIFHEITKKAIHKSIQNVHQLNMNSVNAQQGRRILDRLVGYSLSPLLWKHIDTNTKGLSAGRVQSTLLLILQNHEENILNYNPEKSYKYIGLFNDSPDCELITKYETDKIFTILKKDKNYKLIKQYHEKEKKYSKDPFITSTLQQYAQKELGFNVKSTMNIAQKLYENGKITYMRTDSKNISSEFQGELHDYISNEYGDNYFYRRSNHNKVKGAQEAHECIRVTSLTEKLNDKYTDYDKKLYELIRKNTITSHMKPAIYDKLIYHLSNDNLKKDYFKGIKKLLIFDGYLKYSDNNLELFEKVDDIKQTNFILNECNCEENISNPPQYFNESLIVKKLENSGIGRPSTYASIINTLYNRNYTEIKNIPSISKEKSIKTLDKNNEIIIKKVSYKSPDQKKRIILTDLGKKVLNYLMNHFSMIINIEFTSRVETELDRVSLGEIEWQSVVGNVYNSFKDVLIVQKSLKNTKSSKKDNREKNLGKLNDKDVILKTGPYGYYVSYNKKNVSLSYYLKDNPTDFDDILLNDIKNIIIYPMKLGKFKNKDVVIQLGPYGKYMKYDKRNYRIPQKELYKLDECIRLLK